MIQEAGSLYTAKRGTYLNTGTSGVMSGNVLSALEHGYREFTSNPTYSSTDCPYLGAWQHTNRKALGKAVGASHNDIVLTNNTTMGLHIALNGLTFETGDEILSTNHEHLSVDSPLWILENRFGVKIRRVDTPHAAKEPKGIVEAFEKSVTPNTKLACFSHVTWTTGVQFPVTELCVSMREKGVLTLVDGAHALGMIPIDIKTMQPDFYAASGHKWLNGPPGTGFLYLKDSIDGFWSTLSEFEHIRPHARGISLADSMQARGQVDTPALGAMIEALNLYERRGRTAVAKKIIGLSDHLRNLVISEWGEQSLLSPHPKTAAESVKSGIVSFVPSKDLSTGTDKKTIDELNRKLSEDFNVWGRTIQFKKGDGSRVHAIRFCTHHNNDIAEIDDAVSALAHMNA